MGARALLRALCVAYEIILADFNLVVSTTTTKPPNLIPHQIFHLYGRLLAKNILIITVLFTCCEGSCIHWASREHPSSTEPTLGDSETVANVFLQSIKYVLLTISIQPALINIGPTCSRCGTAVYGKEPPMSNVLR